MIIRNLLETKHDPRRRPFGKVLKSAGVTIGGRRVRAGEAVQFDDDFIAKHMNQVTEYMKRGIIRLIADKVAPAFSTTEAEQEALPSEPEEVTNTAPTPEAEPEVVAEVVLIVALLVAVVFQ